MLRRRLAAQENRGRGKLRPVQVRLNSAGGQQLQKAALIFGPASVALLVSIQQFLRRSQQRLVRVINAAEGLQEVREIVPLGETRKLRRVVEPNIEQALDSSSLQSSEEIGGSALGEADCRDLSDFQGTASVLSASSNRPR